MIDCASAKIQTILSKLIIHATNYSIDQVTGNNAKINAIAHFKKSTNQVLISSEDSLVIYDLQKQTIVDTLI